VEGSESVLNVYKHLLNLTTQRFVNAVLLCSFTRSCEVEYYDPVAL